MNLYFELLKKPVFNMEDVNVFYNNMNSARSAVKRLTKEDVYKRQGLRAVGGGAGRGAGCVRGEGHGDHADR